MPLHSNQQLSNTRTHIWRMATPGSSGCIFTEETLLVKQRTGATPVTKSKQCSLEKIPWVPMCSCKAQGELHMLLDFSLALSEWGSLGSAWAAGDGAGPDPAHSPAGTLALFCTSDFQSTTTAGTASRAAMLHSHSWSHLWVSTTNRLFGLPKIPQESTGEGGADLNVSGRSLRRKPAELHLLTPAGEERQGREGTKQHRVPAFSHPPKLAQHTAPLHAGLQAAISTMHRVLSTACPQLTSPSRTLKREWSCSVAEVRMAWGSFPGCILALCQPVLRYAQLKPLRLHINILEHNFILLPQRPAPALHKSLMKCSASSTDAYAQKAELKENKAFASKRKSISMDSTWKLHLLCPAGMPGAPLRRGYSKKATIPSTFQKGREEIGLTVAHLAHSGTNLPPNTLPSCLHVCARGHKAAVPHRHWMLLSSRTASHPSGGCFQNLQTWRTPKNTQAYQFYIPSGILSTWG